MKKPFHSHVAWWLTLPGLGLLGDIFLAGWSEPFRGSAAWLAGTWNSLGAALPGLAPAACFASGWGLVYALRSGERWKRYGWCVMHGALLMVAACYTAGLATLWWVCATFGAT